MDRYIPGEIKRNKPGKPKIVEIGPPGVGKSSLPSQIKNVVYIPAEDGLGDLDVMAYPQPETYQQFNAQVRDFIYDDDNDTLVVDTIDHIEKLVILYICNRDKKKSLEDYGYNRGFIRLANMFRDEILPLFDEIYAKNKMIILIGHTKVITVKDYINGNYDKHGFRLTPLVAELIEAWADIILFCTFDIYVKKENRDDKKGRATGTGERLMYTVGTPSYLAKNRYHLPEELPLSWTALQSAMRESMANRNKKIAATTTKEEDTNNVQPK